MNHKYLYIKFTGESNKYLTQNNLYYVIDYFRDDEGILIYVIQDDDNIRHFISKNYELIEADDYI